MAKVVDFQRSRVYNWERANRLYEDKLDMTEAKLLITQVWMDYDMPGSPPALKLDTTRTRATAQHSSHSITTGLGQLTVRYMLHEIAHHLSWQIHGVTAENRHGAGFVKLLTQLRVRYAGDNAAELLRSAQEHKLQIMLNTEVERLTLLKNQTRDPEARKRIRRQIRSEMKKALKEAAGSEE